MGHVEQEVDITAPALTAKKKQEWLLPVIYFPWSALFSIIYIYTHTDSWLTYILKQREKNHFFLLFTKSSQKSMSYSASIHVEIILLLHVCKKSRAMRSLRTTTTKVLTTQAMQWAHCINCRKASAAEGTLENWQQHVPNVHLDSAWSTFPSYICIPGLLQEFWLFTYCWLIEFPGQSSLQIK